MTMGEMMISRSEKSRRRRERDEDPTERPRPVGPGREIAAVASLFFAKTRRRRRFGRRPPCLRRSRWTHQPKKANNAGGRRR